MNLVPLYTFLMEVKINMGGVGLTSLAKLLEIIAAVSEDN